MLDVRYRTSKFQTALEWLKQSSAIGPSPPWEAPQRSFQFGKPLEKKAKLDLKDTRGYWAGLKLCELEETTSFSHDA